jgi:hypothetical protein
METADMLRRLQLDPKALDWQRLIERTAPLQLAESAAAYAISEDTNENKAASFTNAIAEAKRKLADSLGIGAEKIEITIRL